MSVRYLALVQQDFKQREQVAAQIEQLSPLRTVFASSLITMLMEPNTGRHTPIGERGILVGWAFARHGASQAVREFSPTDCSAIQQTLGMALRDAFWGGYVALLETPTGVHVSRDPSSAMQCYYIEVAGVSAFASDAELLWEAGLLVPSIDWRSLGRGLYTNGLPTADTAIAKVSELLPGTCLTLSGTSRHIWQSWSPWDFAATDQAAGTIDAEELARAVRQSVEAWASCHQRILVGVSGGLDSSIVASCLNSVVESLSCLTVATTAADGDERLYADILARYLDRELIEARYCLDDIDLAKSAAPHLPFPVSRSQSLSYDAQVAQHVRSRSSDAFFTGNGGDNVFAYSHSATALYDRFLFEGFGRGLFETLANICKLTGCSPWQALRSAAKIARRGTRRYRWQTNPLFLASDIIAEEAKRPPTHDWLDAPGNALPGKAAHIAGLLQIQRHLHASERSIGAPIVNPLMSQPVMEACLAVPSWAWCAGGLNRSVARRAFKADLPEALIFRTTKGRPDSFCGEIIDARRSEIRTRLLEGQLAKNHLLDIAAIEAALSDRAPNLGQEKVRLLTLLEVEAWLALWSERKGVPHFRNPSASSLSASQ